MFYVLAGSSKSSLAQSTSCFHYLQIRNRSGNGKIIYEIKNNDNIFILITQTLNKTNEVL